MADRLVVMSEGRIRQIGSQQDLYERPAEKFVADFVGRSTFIDGRMDGPGRFVSAGGLVVACEGSGAGDASLALRPERLALMSAPRPAMDNSFPGRRGIHLLSRIAGGSARPPVAKGTRHRADPEPAGTAAAGDRRTGPCRLEQIDRPRISNHNYPCQPSTPGGTHHDPIEIPPRSPAWCRSPGRRRQPAAHRVGAGERPHRRRHLGRRLRPPAQQEHRGAAPDQGRLGGGAGPGRRSRAALENARRAAAAARHDRCAGSFGAQHVPDARRRQCRCRSTTASSRMPAICCRR